MTTQLFDAVEAAIRDAAARAVMPRWRLLDEGAVSEKAPGEWVTDADHEARAAAHRRAPHPRAWCAGRRRRGCRARPVHRRRRPPSTNACWLLDPLDGTRSFIAGSPDFATMVALVEHGVTTAAWVWQPVHAHMFVAVRGRGLARDGEPLTRPTDLAAGSPLHGVQRTSLMPRPLRHVVEAAFASAALPPAARPRRGRHVPAASARASSTTRSTGGRCPWDHAPGELSRRRGRPDCPAVSTAAPTGRGTVARGLLTAATPAGVGRRSGRPARDTPRTELREGSSSARGLPNYTSVIPSPGRREPWSLLRAGVPLSLLCDLA